MIGYLKRYLFSTNQIGHGYYEKEGIKISYQDLGFNEFLIRDVKSPVLDQQLNSLGFDLFSSGQNIDATNVIAGLMNFDRLQGGELTLGGLGNKNGVFSLRDENDIERILLDKDGMVIDEGKITIKDTNNQTIIDSKGLVSGTSFIADQIVGNDTQTITDTVNYVDVISPRLVFTASNDRNVNVLLFGMVTYQTGSSVGGEMILTLEDNINLSATMVGSTITSATFITIKKNLSPGPHTLKFRGRKKTNDIVLTTDPRTLGYLILGT